MYVSVEEGGWL